jgi:predicted permease
MDPYSLTLLAALVAAGVALVAPALSWRAPGRPGRRAGHRPGEASTEVLRRAARWASAAAFALALISLGIHLGTGHRPGTPAALGPAEFLRHHPMPVAVALLSIVGLVGASRRR